jgi:hypothetical protein
MEIVALGGDGNPQLFPQLGQWMILEPERRKDLPSLKDKSLIHMVV